MALIEPLLPNVCAADQTKRINAAMTWVNPDQFPSLELLKTSNSCLDCKSFKLIASGPCQPITDSVQIYSIRKEEDPAIIGSGNCEGACDRKTRDKISTVLHIAGNLHWEPCSSYSPRCFLFNHFPPLAGSTTTRTPLIHHG